MDFVKKATGGGKEEQKEQAPGQAQQAQGEAGQKADYVDKAFDAGAKKAGHTIDPNTREKITDSGREAFEKASGKKVPDKVSN